MKAVNAHKAGESKAKVAGFLNDPKYPHRQRGDMYQYGPERVLNTANPVDPLKPSAFSTALPVTPMPEPKFKADTTANPASSNSLPKTDAQRTLRLGNKQIGYHGVGETLPSTGLPLEAVFGDPLKKTPSHTDAVVAQTPPSSDVERTMMIGNPNTGFYTPGETEPTLPAASFSNVMNGSVPTGAAADARGSIGKLAANDTSLGLGTAANAVPDTTTPKETPALAEKTPATTDAVSATPSHTATENSEANAFTAEKTSTATS